MLELGRIDRVTRTYALAEVLKGAVPAGVTSVEVALLPPRSGPTAATVWFATTYAAGSFTILLAGPDADSTGALVVPASADLWMKITDAPEVDAVKVERISVPDGGSLASLPALHVASVAGLTGAVTAASLVAALATPLSAAYATYPTLAANPESIVVGAITRNADGTVTSAPVVWPDGSPGTYTATTLSSAFPGAVDAYTITYGSPVTKTYTQPAVTRDASTGAVTARPAIVVS